LVKRGRISGIMAREAAQSDERVTSGGIAANVPLLSSHGPRLRVQAIRTPPSLEGKARRRQATVVPISSSKEQEVMTPTHLSFPFELPGT